MPRDKNCVFCKIIAVEIPASVIYENESMIAFLDIGPLAEGHLLVVSREHYASLADMLPTQCAQLAMALPRLARALLEVTEAEGFNLLQNNGRAAGQEVEHVHFHLIPRHSGDGLGYRWKPGQYSGDRAYELASAYQTALSRQQV